MELRDAQPIGKPLFSPDGKYFLLISQRGVLSTNRLQATVWLFDRQSIKEYISGKRRTRPAPKPVVTLSASSNTPVISNVRWLPDSQRIAFLGKRDSPQQQLFVADIRNRTLKAITDREHYVSAYDISGDTTVYSTLLPPKPVKGFHDHVVDVTGAGLRPLLFTTPKAIADLDEGTLETYPSVLHVQKNGRELPLSFSVNGRTLRLFIPTLSLSPDGKWLITVASPTRISPSWKEYRPAFDMGFSMQPGDKLALADYNPWKASSYVLVNLQTGSVSTLIDAPAGRCLGYAINTTAFWLPDNKRAILSNTFVPFVPANSSIDKQQRTEAPVVALVNRLNGSIEVIASLAQPRLEEKQFYRIAGVSWSTFRKRVTLHYASSGDRAIPSSKTFGLKPGGSWAEVPVPSVGSDPDKTDLELSIVQDLNHPPQLSAQLLGEGKRSILWDPNPQLGKLRLRDVSLYHWKDKNGNSWSGILALPPDSSSTVQYPLVIQTHGYDSTRYFVDGVYTTGSGGRALAAKDIVVLQLDMPMVHFKTPSDGSFVVDGLESAIDSLSDIGLIDRHRVGIIGFSYTCFHVLYAITQRPYLFAAATINDGNDMSFVQYLLSTDYNRAFQEISEQTNGRAPFGEGLLDWVQRSPGFNLNKVQTPLLIFALERFDLIFEWEIYAGLRLSKKPVDMFWLREESAPHILVKPHQRYISQQGAVDWFDFWLNGREDVNVVDSDQYARWRELRKLQRDNHTLGN